MLAAATTASQQNWDARYANPGSSSEKADTLVKVCSAGYPFNKDGVVTDAHRIDLAKQ
jgi:hypothetical protein